MSKDTPFKSRESNDGQSSAKQLCEKLCKASKAKYNSQKMSKDTLWKGLRKAADKICNQMMSKDTTWGCTMSKDTALQWVMKDDKKSKRKLT